MAVKFGGEERGLEVYLSLKVRGTLIAPKVLKNSNGLNVEH